MLVVTDNRMGEDQRAGAKLALRAHSENSVPGDQVYIHSDGFTNDPTGEELALRKILEGQVPGITINPQAELW